MTKWVPLFLVSALIPAFAATATAQEPPPKQERPKEVLRLQRITQARAVDIALATVGTAVQGGQLQRSWLPSGQVRPSTFSGSVVRAIEAWNGQPVYFVAVTASGGTGHVRVIVNSLNGQVLGSQVATWDWGNAPAWWVAGANSPPPMRR